MSSRLSALFVGHGSPMNAIQENAFTGTLSALAPRIRSGAKAILMISAHWETQGVLIQASEKPRTIHDFRGFPRELHEIQYPAPGQPALAKEIAEFLKSEGARTTEDWGYDHGSWAILRHLFPKADLPIVTLSLDRLRTPRDHWNLGKKLSALRDDGILLVGSGNIVHNLRMIQWEAKSGADWAHRFDDKVKALLETHQFEKLVDLMEEADSDYRLSVPSEEHFLPLLYLAATSGPTEKIHFPLEGLEMGAISMRSVLFEP